MSLPGVSTADHRATADPFAGLRIERHGDVFVASNPGIGALSALSTDEVVALHVFYPFRHDPPRARRSTAAFLEQAGRERAEADRVVERLEREGWSRSALPRPRERPLVALYFTVTRHCNLSCPYCYQGLRGRRNTDMSVEDAAIFLDKVRTVNPACQINITGGEPFMHPRILDILRLADARDLSFVVLTNGTCIDDSAIAALGGLRGLRYVQLSIDGASAETHDRTRGRGSFEKVMRTFERIAGAGLPFVLAPTIHAENLDDLAQLATLAVENGGWCAPNNLRVLPHEGLDFDRVTLTAEECLAAIRTMNAAIVDRFGVERLAPLAEKYRSAETCNTAVPNANFGCGIGYSLMDLDWNGDVYPCHLAKSPELVLGNLGQTDFDTLFRRAAERGIRVASHQIPKCSDCTFVSTCGGGCRAAAWFAYGSMSREDDQCELHYGSALRRVLASRPEHSEERDPLFIRLPEHVEASDVPAWEERLRARVKPAIRARLRGLDENRAPADHDRVDRLGLELRLQEIDRFLAGAARAAHRAGWETYDRAPEIEQLGHGRLRALIPLAYTPCNLYAVHGPFVALTIVRAATALCREEESIESLESIRWSRPVLCHLSLDVVDASAVAFDTESSAVHGVLRTTSGRRLLFRGDDAENEYVTAQNDYNALSLGLLHDTAIVANDDGWRVPLTTLPAAAKRRLDDPAVAIATLTDLASVAVLTLRSGIPALSCGANGVAASVLGDALRSDAPALRLRLRSSRVSKTGLSLKTWAFRVDPVMSDWATLIMAEADDIRQMLHILHATPEKRR